MSKTIWKIVVQLATASIHEYERILEAYRKFGRQFWFAFHYID